MATAAVLKFEDRRLHAFKRHGSYLIWFVLADVCEVFGIEQATKVADRLDTDQKGVTTIHTPGGAQQMLIVSEDGVYELACTSRKTVAKRFKRWLYREVLPEIRQTGSYQGSVVPLDGLIGELQQTLDLSPSAEVIQLKAAPRPTIVPPPPEWWFSLPVKLRQRWWEETDYGRLEPSETLKKALIGPPLQDEEDEDEDDATARGLWHREASPNKEPPPPNALALDRWTDAGWQIRGRRDSDGYESIFWITLNDAISTPVEKKRMVVSPNGKRQILFCFDPFPPIEVALRTYDTLGYGEYAPIAKATLRHFLA